jgi:hypothetical protein
MQNSIQYPRSSARPIYIMAAVLGLLGLVGLIMMLVAMADVPRQSYYLLIAAFGLLIIALAGALAVLLATNTRRPWGIDPNFGLQTVSFNAEEVDSFSSATEELLRHAVQLPDGNGYGRRQSDDPTVVRRLVAATERTNHAVPPPPSRPSWAAEMLPPQYQEKPREPPPRLAEEPREPPRAEPEPPPFTEVPLDQLDLVPAMPDADDSKQDRANGGA